MSLSASDSCRRIYGCVEPFVSQNRACVCVHMCAQTQDVLLQEVELHFFCIELLKCGHHGFLVVELLYLNTF